MTIGAASHNWRSIQWTDVTVSRPQEGVAVFIHHLTTPRWGGMARRSTADQMIDRTPTRGNCNRFDLMIAIGFAGTRSRLASGLCGASRQIWRIQWIESGFVRVIAAAAIRLSFRCELAKTKLGLHRKSRTARLPDRCGGLFPEHDADASHQCPKQPIKLPATIAHNRIDQSRTRSLAIASSNTALGSDVHEDPFDVRTTRARARARDSIASLRRLLHEVLRWCEPNDRWQAFVGSSGQRRRCSTLTDRTNCDW